MSAENYTPKKFDPTVREIVHEATYRGERIIQTRDPRWVGQADAFGFKLDCGFVVRDELDELVLPLPLQWFYTPYDAIAAIETIHSIVPEQHPNTTMLHEYHKMMNMRRHFWRVVVAIEKVRKTCEDARDFDENPAEAVISIINTLQQSMHER